MVVLKIESCVSILFILCVTWASSRTVCRTSPVALNSSMIGGRTTLSLPDTIRNLTITVAVGIEERDGIIVAHMGPVMADEKKCIKLRDDTNLCYEYAEIHWGKFDAEGSDHIINGKSYPMEIQHYFHRTNSTNSITPLGIGVLSHMIKPGTGYFDFPKYNEQMENIFPENRGYYYVAKILNSENFLLNLGDFLPKNMKGNFYQYKGSISGGCSEERDWIVYENPISVPYELLGILRVSDVGPLKDHYFKISSQQNCILHSHYAATVQDCGEETQPYQARYFAEDNATSNEGSESSFSTTVTDRATETSSFDNSSIDSVSVESEISNATGVPIQERIGLQISSVRGRSFEEKTFINSTLHPSSSIGHSSSKSSTETIVPTKVVTGLGEAPISILPSVTPDMDLQSLKVTTEVTPLTTIFQSVTFVPSTTSTTNQTPGSIHFGILRESTRVPDDTLGIERNLGPDEDDEAELLTEGSIEELHKSTPGGFVGASSSKPPSPTSSNNAVSYELLLIISGIILALLF